MKDTKVKKMYLEAGKPMNVQDRFFQARPRLIRFAQKQSLASECVEDIVQETLIEAWRHLEQLRDPERFDSWLIGICYNVCQRWNRAYSLRRQRYLHLELPHTSLSGNEGGYDFPDPHAFDPSEDLTRQDFAKLLDRALGTLSLPDRKALELYYLDERSQEDIAEQLHTTSGALKVRMYRARQQLWRLLHTQLRTEAEACGLILDDENAVSWRKTSIWCTFCGERTEGRLRGGAEGEDYFRLRCPTCEQKSGFRLLECNVPGLLDEVRSFRPAYKRVIEAIPRFFQSVIEQGNSSCPFCQGRMYFRGTKTLADSAFSFCYILLECSICGPLTTSLSSLYVNLKSWQQFTKQYPRYSTIYTTSIHYDNQSAIRIQFADVFSSAKLHLFVHPSTLRLLGTEQE